MFGEFEVIAEEGKLTAKWLFPQYNKLEALIKSKGNLFARSITAQPPNLDISSEYSFSSARKWLKDCIQSHPHCANRTNLKPTRLVNVDTSDLMKSVKLHTPGEDEELSYLSLSYCWGATQPLQLTKATLEMWQQGVETLPPSKDDSGCHIRYSKAWDPIYLD